MDHAASRHGAIWLTLCGLFQLILGGTAEASPLHSAHGVAGDTPGIRRLVLVHGIYNSGRRMNVMRRYFETRGWRVYAISLKPNDASIPFEAMAAQLDAYVKENIPPGEKFDLAGFSMGGLVSRYYVQKLGGCRRVRRFVTLSAPNHGTLWACLGSLPGVKEMRPGSPMLRDLNGDLSKLPPLGYTSIFTPFDLSIIPFSSSRMPVGRNVLVWVPLHPLMTMMTTPLRAVEKALND